MSEDSYYQIKTASNTVNISVDNIEIDNLLQVTNQLDINQSGDIVTAGNITCGNILCSSINISNISSLNLIVTGTSILNGSVSIGSSLNVSGASVFENSIQSKNTLTTNNLNVTNNSNLNGATTIASTLNVSGASVFENSIQSKNTLTTNNLNVSGLTNFYNNVDLNNAKILDVSNIDNNGLPLNIRTLTDDDITLTRYTGPSVVLKNNYINNNGAVITSGNQTNNSNLNVLGDLNVSGQSAFTGNLNCGYLSASEVFCPNVDYTGTLDVGSTSCTTLNLGCGNHTQTIDIGTGAGTTTINIGGAGDTVNIAGTLNNITSQSLVVSDKNILLNNGAVGSGTARGAGLSIRDNNSDTQAYIQVSNVGTSYDIKAPENNFVLNTGVLSQNETIATTSNISGLSSIYFRQSGGIITGATTVASTLATGDSVNIGTSLPILNLNSTTGQSLIRQSTGNGVESWTNWVFGDSSSNFIYRNSGGADYNVVSYKPGPNGMVINTPVTATSSLNIVGTTTVNSTLNLNDTVNIQRSSGTPTLQINCITGQSGLFRINSGVGAANYSHTLNGATGEYDLTFRNFGGADYLLQKFDRDVSLRIYPPITALSNLNCSGTGRFDNSLNVIGNLNLTTGSNIPLSVRKNTSSGDCVMEIGRSSLSDACYLGVEGNNITLGHRSVRGIFNYNLTTQTSAFTTNLNLDGNLNYSISNVKVNRRVCFGFDGSATPTLSRIRPSGISAGITNNGTGLYTITVSGPSNLLASSSGIPMVTLSSASKDKHAVITASNNIIDISAYDNNNLNNLTTTTFWVSYDYE